MKHILIQKYILQHFKEMTGLTFQKYQDHECQTKAEVLFQNKGNFTFMVTN